MWFVGSIFIKILRGCDSKYFVPSFTNSCGNSASMKAEPFRPFCSTESFSIVCYEKISGFVSAISFCKNPTTVFEVVISIIIDSIKLMFGRWPFFHVFDKLPKVVSPLVADLNAHSSIVFKSYVLWVVTSSVHRTPCFIKGMFAHFDTHVSYPFHSWFIKQLDAQFLRKEYKDVFG